MTARPTTPPSSYCAPNSVRAAFTLVELLMVILIIGMLLGLLFPAINAARENGRRTQCINKMKEIASAIQSFEKDESRYPGWMEYPFGMRDVNSSNSTYGMSFNTSVNYFVPLLPYLGRNDIFSPGGNAMGAWKTPQFDGNNPPQTLAVVQPALHKITVCPSDSTKLGSTAPELSYVCNSGRHDEQTNVAPWDWKANGIFMDLRPRDENLGLDQPAPRQYVNASYVRNNDGLDTTLLLSEKLSAGYWSNIGDEDGTTFHYILDGSDQPIPNEGINTGGDEYPSSNHPGGVVVVFAGMNQRFITNEVDFRVWVALHTPNGEHSKIPGTNNPSPFAQNQPKLTDAVISP